MSTECTVGLGRTLRPLLLFAAEEPPLTHRDSEQGRQRAETADPGLARQIDGSVDHAVSGARLRLNQQPLYCQAGPLGLVLTHIFLCYLSTTAPLGHGLSLRHEGNSSIWIPLATSVASVRFR